MSKNAIVNMSGYECFVKDVKDIISQGRQAAYNTTNTVIVSTYWNIGKRIVEEEQHGSRRAEYGKEIISVLSKELTKEFGKNYSERNLRYYRRFYSLFPNFEIWNACVPNLTWTHFRRLLSVPDEDARIWYMQEAYSEGWTARMLDRNISTQYYYRFLEKPSIKQGIEDESTETVKSSQVIKSPTVAEFLGFSNKDSYVENDLETALLNHLVDFMLELGRGFSFVGRQEHIVTETEDYYIDLVFYNIELKCYVIVDLKTGTVTHQDVGQIDMYVRIYDELKRGEGDNPTVGILLCAQTDKDIARYSVLHDNERLFMSKYLTYLPSKEQLEAEIKREKELFYEQHMEYSETERGGSTVEEKSDEYTFPKMHDKEMK